jgi:hypothetical protein
MIYQNAYLIGMAVVFALLSICFGFLDDFDEIIESPFQLVVVCILWPIIVFGLAFFFLGLGLKFLAGKATVHEVSSED